MYDCDNNRSPGATAGGDRKITLPKDSVLLNGSASSEADGKVTKWLWTKITAPASLVIANTTDTATMVKNLIAGVYSFELKVTDDKGGAATDTVHIVVDSPSVNRLPIACAGTGYFIQQITSSLPGTKHSPACAHLYCSFTMVVLADTLFS